MFFASAFVAFSFAAGVVDSKTIDRTITREPDYHSGAPKYCLVQIGSEAKAPVWLVVDDTTMYVDRNGNGDLTDDGEPVKLDASVDNPKGFWKRARVFTVQLTLPSGTEPGRSGPKTRSGVFGAEVAL